MDDGPFLASGVCCTTCQKHGIVCTLRSCASCSKDHKWCSFASKGQKSTVLKGPFITNTAGTILTEYTGEILCPSPGTSTDFQHADLLPDASDSWQMLLDKQDTLRAQVEWQTRVLLDFRREVRESLRDISTLVRGLYPSVHGSQTAQASQLVYHDGHFFPDPQQMSNPSGH